MEPLQDLQMELDEWLCHRLTPIQLLPRRLSSLRILPESRHLGETGGRAKQILECLT